MVFKLTDILTRLLILLLFIIGRMIDLKTGVVVLLFLGVSTAIR